MIARDLAAQWAATAWVAAVSLALVFALGRLLGPGGFGDYSYVLTVASLLAIVQDGGFRTLIFREGTAATPRLAHAGMPVAGVASAHLLLTTVVLVGLAAVAAPGLDQPFAIACLAMVALSQFVSARLKAEGRFVTEAGWQATTRTATALAIVAALVVLGPSLTGIFAAWGLALVLAVLAVPAARRRVARPRWAFPGGVYRACLAFVVIDAATTVYFRIDVVMIRQITGDSAQVGYYSAAYRLFEAVILLAAPIAQMSFRHLRLRFEDRAAFRGALARMLLGMAAAAVVVVAGGYVLGPAVIDLAFGPGFEPAHALLPWLLGSLAFALPNFMLTQAAIALNREGFYALAACGAAGVNVALNAWLIPGHGALGAAWATLATEAALGIALAAGMGRWVRARKA